MNIQKLFIVEYEKQIIGIWDSYESAKTFIMGCHQNKLMISVANIKTYQINTCFCLETNCIELLYQNISHSNEKSNIYTKKSLDFSENVVEEKVKDKDYFTSPAYMEITKQKKELQHTINMLKQQKKKIEESKTTYANDYKLFKLFTESKQKDPNFIIPEIFSKKFDLMTDLNNKNNLSWETFVSNFQYENMYNDYFGLNSYEELFLESDNINEELFLESDNINEEIFLESNDSKV